ncbi:vomeronasal type-2 receptor 26-like, partial [Pelobates cultripes]
PAARHGTHGWSRSRHWQYVSFCGGMLACRLTVFNNYGRSFWERHGTARHGTARHGSVCPRELKRHGSVYPRELKRQSARHGTQGSWCRERLICNDVILVSRHFISEQHNSRYLGECITCFNLQINQYSDNCIKCPDDEWPNKKKNLCISKTVEFLAYNTDVISIVFEAFSIFFCILSIIILRIFILYQDTPIVRANNQNLSLILLVSIILSFLCVFLFLGRPVDITCMLRQSTFGLIFSVAVSCILAKTIIVCIAFKATKPGSLWRRWVGVKVSNFVVLICSSVQVLINVIWLSISPPFQEFDMHSYPGKIIIQCNEGSVIAFYCVLCYMGFLASMSFVLAFMVRTLPDSFNEAKYITFSMLVFCSVWIAMIPAYLSTKGKYIVAIEIFAILASSAGILGCIFFPKCYIILFSTRRRELALSSNGPNYVLLY